MPALNIRTIQTDCHVPYLFDDGHGDYNRSYERDYDDFDYADYSTDHRDNNFRNYEKKTPQNQQRNNRRFAQTLGLTKNL